MAGTAVAFNVALVTKYFVVALSVDVNAVTFFSPTKFVVRQYS